jgi:cytochrome P450
MHGGNPAALASATLADETVLRNPFPFYRMLREQDPVHYDSSLNAWLVSRYADVRRVLLETDTFSMERGWRTNYAHGFAEEFAEILKRDGGGLFPDVIMTDPPYHTRKSLHRASREIVGSRHHRPRSQNYR